METITRICPVCNKEYPADVTRLRCGRQTTCSRECSYRRRGRNKKRAITRICQTCGTEFPVQPWRLERNPDEAKFCSGKCYGRSREKPPRMLTCAHCGRQFRDIQGPGKNRHRLAFCSTGCSGDYHQGPKHPYCRGGRHAVYYGEGWTKARRQARERDQCRC